MNKKFHGEFDPEFDKLPDQPVTIGGDKSSAAWHPNSGPEVLNADLSARLRGLEAGLRLTACDDDANAIADALAALGDTVPANASPAITIRAEYENTVLAKQLVEARAERDALAHVIERGRALRMESGEHLSPWAKDALDKLIAESDSAKAMALHDAEVWDEGYKASITDHDSPRVGMTVNPYRAGAK